MQPPYTTVQLGNFVFRDFEVPESITWGGAQRMSVKTLIGGKRVIDCMGREDMPLSWSGIITGQSAVDRARALDQVRIDGLPVDLTFEKYRYRVVVREFEATHQLPFRIPYRITCEVQSDLVTPPKTVDLLVDQVVADDMASINAALDGIDDEQLSAVASTLQTSIAAVPNLSQAPQSAINSILAPLTAMQGRVVTLIQDTSSALTANSTFGGVLPNTPFSQVASRLASQTDSMLRSNSLFSVRNRLGRINANLVSINSPQQTVSVVGGNLFQIASQEYGDATAWTAIAKANGMTDPFITGPTSLAIPSLPGSSDGVLSA